MSSWNQSFLDLQRLRTKYASSLLIQGLNLERENLKYSVGYNEGKNRRELLALFPKETKEAESFISFRSSSSSSEGRLVTWEFLRSRRRQDYSGRFFLDLRGTVVEKNFDRRLNDTDLDLLFKFIGKRSDICGINLAYNSLTKHGFAKLSEFLAEHNTLLYVNVMNNDITYLDQKRLEEDVSKWKVQCLNLRGNKIGQKGGETWAYLLKKNSTIRHLALGETEQNVNSIISIVNTLVQFGGNETLTKLDLTRTVTKTKTGEMCRHLACVLEVNRSLVELVLSKNNITDIDLEILLEGLKHRNVLLRLNLSCNQISSHGAELIAAVLPISELKILVLASNMIGDSGAMAIGRVFSLTKLKFLDLSMNRIGDLGMTHLVWAICRPMDGFFIFGNQLTEHTIKVIHSQITDLIIDPKTLDIRLWFDEGRIRFVKRNLWDYSHWYYYVPEWTNKFKIQHCCCPIRGGVMLQLSSDD